ncbi:ankyrin repeat protein [Ancylostoma duodenale]|uniref:Ankyrin repeat protein n=1 Tax=Ancylostoma duodenale TaxID=51022 RepID=A0A0C2C9J6_9BILA|nr:ankyrin repeat protein [Ancylostoma duodenale]
MNMTIYSADAKRPRNGRTSLDVSLLILLACITVMIVIAILFIVHERPNEKTKGYSESNWQRRVILESAKRRRIDHSEMKLLEEQWTPKGPKVPRVFVLPKAKKIEPLPSRLHIEAASANPISVPIAAEDVNQRGPNGRTPVMVLVRNTTKSEEQIIEDLTRLRSAGADLNLWDDYDDTALHVTVSSGRLPVVRKLLQLGASPVIRDHKNSTCLHLAARMCSLDMVKILLEVEEMKMEVDAVDDDNRTALMLVAMHDRVDAKIAEALCAAGAKVNYDGDNTLNTWTGRTALHFAAKYDNAQMVAFLLEKNANKDCQDHECCTPLHLAASEGHEGPVKELIKAGASVMLRNDKSQTPYDTALVNNQAGVAALLASGDNLRVQLYSNNGEIFASSTPPGIKGAIHSPYMDSGFGTFTDGSTYDQNSHWSISNEPINRSVLSPHERFVCNDGYIV